MPWQSSDKGRRKGIKRNRPYGIRFNLSESGKEAHRKIKSQDREKIKSLNIKQDNQRILAEIYGVDVTTIFRIVKYGY